MPLRKSVRPVIDSLVIATILVVANFVFGSEDRGWLELNPSPFLLLPVLIGGKYGLRAGFASGIGGMLLTLVLGCSTGTPMMEVLKSAPMVFLALPISGLITGELNRQSGGRRESLEAENKALALSQGAFEKELEVAREAQHLLQRELSLQGADVCSLDLELRKIFEPGAPPVLRGTLAALAEVSGITNAAFYLLDEAGQQLRRNELIGEGAFFPDVIGSKHTKMAWAAIESDELVTCRGLGEGKADVGKARFLAAVPWRSAGKTCGVLLIHDIPFVSMNWQTLARIELVCDWVSALGETRGQDVVARTEVMSTLELVGRSASEQGLPSAIALIAAIGTLGAGEIRDLIAGEMGASDVAVEVEDRGLAVLLPLGAGRDAEASAERFTEALTGANDGFHVKLLTVDQQIEAGALWDEISTSIGV